ncbi:CaiB/BaiF CoA transferase family protein [Bosea sp. NPDC055594]
MQRDSSCSTDNREPSARLEARGLSGLRVLDLGRYIAAPLCAAMLGDQGAEVIRIESPEGAADREVMPVGIDGRGSLYLQMNRNKKSLTLDFSQPSGRRILDRLIAASDVVVVNLPHRPLVKLGLDYESLRQLNPEIILTTVSAFAYSGNQRDRVGFDGMGQALSGAMYLSGTGERPMRAAVSYVDYATGASAAFATAAALFDRAITGRGQHVECSLMGTALTMMNPILVEEATGARRRTATANRSPIAGPSDLFKAQDGWIMVQVIGKQMFERWTELVGRPELAADPRFLTDIDRGENGEVLSTIMGQWCAERTLTACLEATEAARIPACPILTPAQALAAESASDYFELMPFDGAPVSLPIATANIRTRAFSAFGIKPAPRLGADTDMILQGLDIGPDDIEALRRQGVV